MSGLAATPLPPSPVQNHTLSAENCGPARGRDAWHIGAVQCHVMDVTGAIVAIHKGGAPVSYSGTPVQREIQYVDDNWYTQGTNNYRYVPNEDCANFASQALLARGWPVTADWAPYTLAWVSSTHLRVWILATHSRIKELAGVESFSRVKVGDIAQFDWYNTGVRDHTAIVTEVTRVNGVLQVYVGEHTDPFEYRNVRDMITNVHPGASVYFLSLPSLADPAARSSMSRIE
jgi:hypothetical protein